MFRREYKLIRLRAETVEELKRLRSQMGKASIDGLITWMVNLADAKRLEMMNDGWQHAHSRRRFVGN